MGFLDIKTKAIPIAEQLLNLELPDYLREYLVNKVLSWDPKTEGVTIHLGESYVQEHYKSWPYINSMYDRLKHKRKKD